ncbi:uncharacterized protein AC631_03490 [Debaryomyces fabryi]|uniref:RING-type domain-containing protein n=1 Tax=Debaryomyces fabryi TaxID=58627 RepID=A0A0V1PWZ4_9ASCO|nr:uncharacterized protein AC631_03490 [Debaryomyces fabryi]KSA00779.1 hypothetical protein AC631_03490 [Debaryomyces fabryi]CUM45202.1 unnamed protein product [Debaryomyces fabryi]
MNEKRKSKLSIINNIMKPISPPRRRHSNETLGDPIKISRNTVIPPPLTFPKIPQLEGYSISDHSNPERGIRKKNFADDRCVFCEELLSNKLAGELGLQLTCSHSCHKYCFLEMMDKNNLESLPFCTQCEKKTQCVDASIQASIKHQKLAESLFPNNFDKEHSPFDTMSHLKDYDTLVKSSVSANESQLLSPISTPTGNFYNEKLYNEILKPRITVTADAASQVTDGEYDLDCLISVKPSQISNCVSDSSEDQAIKSRIIQNIKVKLALRVNNWSDSLLPLEELGDLRMFDFLEISSNGSDWDNISVYFFGNAIILVDYNGTRLMGEVLINSDISSINRIENVLVLNLSNEALPELYMRHSCSLIISKWEYYLIQAVKKILVGQIPLLHTTTNAWELLDECNRSTDGLKFCSLWEKNLDVPSSLLRRIMPPAENIPMNMNVSISLINCTDLSNLEYKKNIISLLQNLRSKLRPIDKLGLIFVGVDGHGKPSNSGTFIGCVSPSWDGWENIINDIRVFANEDDRQFPIFDNGFEEMLISFEKYKKLLPYIPSGPKNNNRLIILNSNNYDLTEPQRFIKSKINDKISFLQANENLTIDIIRIGKSYSIEAQEVYNLISMPTQCNDSLNIVSGSKLLRFNSFSEFGDSFDFIMEHSLQSGYIPYVTIDFQKVSGIESLISFSEIEMNGEMVSIQSNLTKLRIVVKNVFPLTERNIMMKLKLNFSEVSNLGNIMNYKIINYHSLWMEGEDDFKCLRTKFNETGSPHILFSHESDVSCSPLDQIDGDTYFVDIPLLPPLSSSKDQSFARRKTELAIIRSLRIVESASADETEIIISHLISLVFGIIRGFEIEPGESYKIIELKCYSERRKSFMLHFENFNNNKKYIQCLVEELESINDLFKRDPCSASIRCQDFANWII